MLGVSTIIEPIAIPQAEEEQVRKLRHLIQQGNAKLVGPDGDEIVIPRTIHDF
jgi:hypothetical protein